MSFEDLDSRKVEVIVLSFGRRRDIWVCRHMNLTYPHVRYSMVMWV